MSHIRFSRMMLFAALAASLILPASAAARQRFGIGIGYYGGYGGYYGGPFYPYGYGYGYGPYGGSGYAPYGGYGYYPGRPLGEVHIKSPDPKAQIYINGAFAGQAHDLKTLYLAPGTYNIELRIGTDVQKERVYVLASRSLKLEFDKPGVTHNRAPNAAPDAAPDAAPNPRPEAIPQPAPEQARPEANIAPQPTPAPAPLPEAPRQ
jgi:hypothetical protein